MEFLRPFNAKWKLPPDIKIDESPGYRAIKDFFARPYFCNNWILSELAFARIPVFLVGDMFVSWLQMLRYVFITEEVLERGSIYFPIKLRPLLNQFPLGSVYFFLEEYDRRRQAQSDPENMSSVRCVSSVGFREASEGHQIQRDTETWRRK